MHDQFQEYPWDLQVDDVVEVQHNRKLYKGTITSMEEKYRWGGDDGAGPRICIICHGGYHHIANHIGRVVEYQDGSSELEGRVRLIERPLPGIVPDEPAPPAEPVEEPEDDDGTV